MAGAPPHSLQRFDQAGQRPREMSRKTPWFAPEGSRTGHGAQPSRQGDARFL